MKCRQFEHDLPDWVTGRLAEDRRIEMEAHRALCASCARAEAGERDLRARWGELPPLPEAPDLWPRLAARLDAPRPAPRFVFTRRFALGGALAAGALLALLVSRQGPSPTDMPVAGSGVDEHRVIQMVAEMRKLPDPDSDVVLNEMRDYRQNERFLLTGGGGP